MRKLAESSINRNIDRFIASCKFLNDSKYFKTNKWSWAHWSSSAAKGHVGGCGCCSNGFYNATLQNKRHNRNNHRIDLIKLCSHCVMKIKEKTGSYFIESHAP